MRNSQDKSIKNRLTSHKSQVSVKGDIDNYEQKPPKPSKLSRKEQRARIGLSDIPDEKIEEFVKVKKTKPKPQVLPQKTNKTTHNPVPVFQYTGKSRMSQEGRLQSKKSIEDSKVKVRETLRIKFPEP